MTVLARAVQMLQSPIHQILQSPGPLSASLEMLHILLHQCAAETRGSTIIQNSRIIYNVQFLFSNTAT